MFQSRLSIAGAMLFFGLVFLSSIFVMQKNANVPHGEPAPVVKVEKNAEAEWGVEWEAAKLEELKALVAEAKRQREAARSPKGQTEGGGTAGSCREGRGRGRGRL